MGEKYNGSLCTTDETVGSHLTRCVSCRPPCRHRPGQSVEATTSYDHKNTPTHKGIVQIRPPSEHMLQIYTHTPLKAARKTSKLAYEHTKVAMSSITSIYCTSSLLNGHQPSHRSESLKNCIPPPGIGIQ